MPKPTVEEIQTRFTHRSPNNDQISRLRAIRNQAGDFAHLIVDMTPESREQSLALTALEEAVMWANAAIARRE